MGTIQEDFYARCITLAGGGTYTYNEAVIAANLAQGNSATNFNGAMIELLQGLTGSSRTDINELWAAYLESLNANLSIAANNLMLPYTKNSSSNWVSNACTTHRTGAATYTDIEIWFVNGIKGADQEIDADYDFDLRMGVLYDGTFYPGYVKGTASTRDATMAKEWGFGKFTVPGLTIPPNTEFQVFNRRVATDGGLAGSYNIITSTSGIQSRIDGIINGTDNTVDYTTGTGLGRGATARDLVSGDFTTGVLATGTGTPAYMATAGSGYTAGLALSTWYGAAGAGAAGAEYPGSGIVGFGSSGSGTLTITNGGTGHAPNNPPKLFLSGGGFFGAANQATYGPCLIMGVADADVDSYLVLPDSIYSGYSSTDSTGDLSGSHGGFEQAVAQNSAVWKMGTASDTVAGFNSNKTRQLAFLDDAISAGLKTSNITAVCAKGTNDFSAGTALASVESNMNTMAGEFRSRNFGAVWVHTLPPKTTSTDSFATTANQTTDGAAFAAGADVASYNERLRRGTGAVTRDNIIDTAALNADITAPEKWRVDAFGGTAHTADGTHPSKEAGIPFTRNNLLLPPKTLTLATSSLVHTTAFDTASIAATSGAITQWNDLSGNDRHFVMANASFQPEIDTARYKSHYLPDLYPGSSQKQLHIPSFSFDGTNFAVLIAFLPVTVSGSIRRLFGQADTSLPDGFFFCYDASGKPFAYLNASANTANSTAAGNLVADQVNLLGMWFKDGVVKFYSNGTTLSTVSYTGTTPIEINSVATNFALGGYTSNNVPAVAIQGLRASINEFTFFEPADEAEILSKQAEINSRWEIY